MRTDHAAVARSSLLALTVVAFALAGGGCATQGEKTIESYAETKRFVAESRGKVDKTLVSLHALRSTPAPDLSDGYGRYKDAVRELEQQGIDAEWRAASMRDRADEHISAWQKETAGLTDPTIKATMEARKDAVRANFKLVQMYMRDARDAFKPYLEGNKQIVKALSIDLSPGAVQSLSPSIDRILLDGDALKQKLAAIQHALDNIASGTSAIGPTE